MAGRGAQTFKKRQKEQQRKEKQQEKIAKRLDRKKQGSDGPIEEQPLDWSDSTARPVSDSEEASPA